MKKIFEILFAGLYFAVGGVMILIMVTGAFRWCSMVIQEQIPGFIEWLGIIFVALISGTIGAALRGMDD